MARINNDEAWATIIGGFMMSFGLIESSVNELLRQSCSDATMRFVLPLQLSQRMKLLNELIEEWQLSATNRAALKGNLEEVRSLTTTRNLIAHNPLAFHYFDNGTSSTMRELIKSEHTEASISLPDLLKFARRAEKVATALTDAWIEFDLALTEGRGPKLTRP